jgi:hypothetical protein
MIISVVLHHLPFSQNQALKSADEEDTGILKNKIKNSGSLRLTYRTKRRSRPCDLS